MFILQIIPATGAYSTGVGENLPTEAPQVSTVVQITVNTFTGTLQGNWLHQYPGSGFRGQWI